MKIKLMLVIALVTLMSVFMSGCGSETKLGYLDAERVMNEAPQIKTIRDNIDAKNKEIEAKETDLMSKKATMSDEEFKKAAAAYIVALKSQNEALKGMYSGDEKADENWKAASKKRAVSLIKFVDYYDLKVDKKYDKNLEKIRKEAK